MTEIANAWTHDPPPPDCPPNKTYVLNDTIIYIQNCAICNINKSPRQTPARLLQPLPTPQCPWSHITINFVTDLPVSPGHTAIFTIYHKSPFIDPFSKACRLIPLPKLSTAFEIAFEHLCNYIFRLYGLSLPEGCSSPLMFGQPFTSNST